MFKDIHKDIHCVQARSQKGKGGAAPTSIGNLNPYPMTLFKLF